MRYGSKSFQNINEAEKRQILGLYKKMDLEYIFETKFKTNVEELISDFEKSLIFQKKYLSAIFENLPVSKSSLILNTIKEDTINNLFGQNKLVVENYYSLQNNIIIESVSDIISELDKFYKFLKNSISLELNRLNEQSDFMMDRRGNALLNATGIRSDKDYQQVNKIMDDAENQQRIWFSKAVNYIKQKGVGFFMEQLRSALFSAAGTAIQILVSITGPATAGIGPAIVTGIWCILGLYDMYQISQGVDGAWANFIIDVICALTAGSLGGVLGKFAGTAGKSLVQALEGLIAKGLGPYVIPVVYALKKSVATVVGWFKWAGNFSKVNLGMGWLSGKITVAIESLNTVIERLALVLGKSTYTTAKLITSLIPKSALRTAGALAARVNPQVWGHLSNLSAHEVSLFAGQTLEQGALKAIEKEANSRFREKPTQQLLEYVDQTFGTAYSDAYLAYLGGKKLFKYQNGKLVSAVENTANTFRGEANYTDKQGNRLKQGIGAVSGEKPTSAQLSSVKG